MKLLSQNPAPALLTGHSPPQGGQLPTLQTNASQATPAQSSKTTANAPRFQGLPENALSQFISDTLGVWAPKVPLTRSKTQFFEDAFLELVEDGAFYFTLPVVGPLLGGLLNKVVTQNQAFKQWGESAEIQRLKKELNVKPPESPEWFKKLKTKIGINTTPDPHEIKWLVGTPLRKVTAKVREMNLKSAGNAHFDEALLRPLIATKLGALLGTVAVAAGFEYMIQHTKNVITAKQFKTKNFAAVAGLESGKAHTTQGQTDPVEKARKRSKQVGLFVLGSLGLAAIAPQAVLHNQGIANAAKKFLHVADFDKGFDISKPALAFLIGTGVVSYVDAARDSLERKETATRLAVVAPYLMFGKEIAGYTMAKFMDTFNTVDVGNKTKRPLKDFVPFTNGKNPITQALDYKNTFLDMNVRKNTETLVEELEKSKVLAEYANNPALVAKIRAAVIGSHAKLENYSYLLSALVCGLGINWIVYKQTQKRYQLQQAEHQNDSKPAASLPTAPSQTAGLQVPGPASLKPASILPTAAQPFAAFSGHPAGAAANPSWPASWPTLTPASPFALPLPTNRTMIPGSLG